MLLTTVRTRRFGRQSSRPFSTIGMPDESRERFLAGHLDSTRRSHRKCLGFRYFRRMVRIGETCRRFRLRILRKSLARCPNQTGILRLTPSFAGYMHATPVPWFARADAAAVALDDRQLRRRFRPLGQGDRKAVGLRIASRRQFASNGSHHALHRVRRHRHAANLLQGKFGASERPRFRRRKHHALDHLRRQRTGIQSQGFTLREKKISGNWDSRRPTPATSHRHRPT